MRLKDKVAIVTGGASGLGKAIALRFASEGAIVIVVDLNESAMAQTAEEIRSLGGKARGYKIDVTQQQDLRNFMEDVVATEGRLDVLVNNAGITRYRAFGGIGDADWNAVLDLDLKGVFFCTQAAARTWNGSSTARSSTSLRVWVQAPRRMSAS